MNTVILNQKRIVLILTVVFLTYGAHGISYAQDVSIPDPNLRAAVEEALGKALGDTITTHEMETLTELVGDTLTLTEDDGGVIVLERRT